jgi:hypothetical protein
VPSFYVVLYGHRSAPRMLAALASLFITASVPTVTSTTATRTMTKGLFIVTSRPPTVHWSDFRGLKINPQ